MKKLIYICYMVLMTLLLNACAEMPDYADPKKSNPPGPVSNPIVENLYGGVRITYTLPADDDLLGVKAVYYFKEEGNILESFSSAYNNTIELHGFPDTLERKVKLLSLDKSRNESIPVEVIIQPLTPPVERIRQSLKVKETFGGVTLRWSNVDRAEIAIQFYASDESGNLVYDDAVYTNEANGIYAFRGYDDTERMFSVKIRDRWGNFSTPLDTTLMPLFEKKIRGRDEFGNYLWSRYGWDDGTVEWRGDLVGNHSAANRQFYWIHSGFNDGDNFWNSNAPGNWLSDFTGKTEDNYAVVPFYFTIDLGRSCFLTRHKSFHRNHNRALGWNHLKYYELWATNETPKAPNDFANKMESLAYWTSWEQVGGTDAWKNDWVKIAVCDFIPPSGATREVDVTEDDRIWAMANGFEFDIFLEVQNQPFRYIRFVNQPNWSASTIAWVAEMEFYGNIAK